MEKNIFEQLNCKEDGEYKGIYYHPKLPFELSEINGMLSLSYNLEYTLSQGRIPVTKVNLLNLIAAFNP